MGEDDDYKLTAEPDGNLFKLWFTFDGLTELEDQALWGHIGYIYGDSGCDALAEGVYEGIGAGGTICKRFNGTNNYIQVFPSEHLTIEDKSQFSIFIRFKVDDVTQEQTLFEKFDDLDGTHAYKAIVTNRRLVFMVSIGGTGYTKVNGTNLINGTWYDAWLRRDGITLSVYINGVDATMTLNSAGFSEEGFSSGGFTTRFPPVQFNPIPTSGGVGTSLIIGSDGNLDQFFKGYIQDFRIWAKLVTPTEIANQWTNKVSISNIAFERCAVVGYAPIRAPRRRTLPQTITFVDSITATYLPTNPKIRTISQSITFSDSITPLKNEIKPAHVNDIFSLDDSISIFREAIQIKVGSIIKSTKTTGYPFNVSHATEIGFKPKFMMFYGLNIPSFNTFYADPMLFIGFSDGTNNIALSASSNDGVSPTETAKGLYDSSVLTVNHQNSLKVAAKCTFTATGFDLTYTSNTNEASIINYIAFGGSELTGVKVGTFAQPQSTTGIFSFTDVGFQSNGVMLLPTQFTTINSKSVNFGFSFGAFDSTLNMFSFSMTDQNNVSTTENKSLTRFDRAITLLGSEPTGYNTAMKSANVVEITPTGFDLNYDVNQATGGTAGLCGYVALQGINTFVGKFTVVAASTGIQTITEPTLSFKPLLLIFMSQGKLVQTDNTPNDNILFSLGTVVNSLNRRNISLDIEDNTSEEIAVCTARSNASFVIMDASITANNSSTKLIFDILSISEGQFTINKSQNTLSGNIDIFYIAFG